MGYGWIKQLGMFVLFVFYSITKKKELPKNYERLKFLLGLGLILFIVVIIYFIDK